MRASGVIIAVLALSGCDSVLGISDHPLASEDGTLPDAAPATQPDGAPATQPDGAPATQPDGAPATQPYDASAPQVDGSLPDSSLPDSSLPDAGCPPCELGTTSIGFCCVK